MFEPISRRRFLRDSAILSGAAALADPHWLFAAGDRPGGAPVGGEDATRSNGVFAQAEYGTANDEFLVRWTRWGGGSTLELRPDVVVIDVPTDCPEVIGHGDFEQGRGHQSIARHFGSPVLAQLKDEVAYLGLFPMGGQTA